MGSLAPGKISGSGGLSATPRTGAYGKGYAGSHAHAGVVRDRSSGNLAGPFLTGPGHKLGQVQGSRAFSKRAGELPQGVSGAARRQRPLYGRATWISRPDSTRGNDATPASGKRIRSYPPRRVGSAVASGVQDTSDHR